MKQRCIDMPHGAQEDEQAPWQLQKLQKQADSFMTCMPCAHVSILAAV